MTSSQSPTPTPTPRPKLLWLISVLLIMSTNARWFTATATLIPGSSNCFLSPTSMWDIPASNLGQFTTPFLVFAGLTALAITILCGAPHKYCATPNTIISLSALSLLAEPQHTIFGFCAVMITAVRQSAWFQKSKTLGVIISATGLIAGIFCSLEFGLLAVLFLATCCGDLGKSNVRKCTGVSIALGLVFSTVLFGGFLQALLRPVNWIPVAGRTDLLPSLGSSFQQHDSIFAITLLCLAFLITGYHSFQRATPVQFLTQVTLMGLALACFRFAWLGGVACLALPIAGNATNHGRHANKVAILMAAVFVIFELGLIRNELKQEFLVADESSELLEFESWRSEGNVVLFNLDQSQNWQNAQHSKKLPLVINDRWDVFGNLYEKYAIALRDFRETRSHSYVMSNHNWAGYSNLLLKWKPTVLVLDSRDLRGVRGLSISPDFKFMGADRKNVVFGKANDRKNKARMNLATRCILKLEWPSQISLQSIAKTIVTKTEADRQTAAEVLLAMRLPFAALRYLKDDEAERAKDIRAECYVELAHRVFRHSNSLSLMHHSRAVFAARERLKQSPTLSLDQRAHFANFLRQVGDYIDNRSAEDASIYARLVMGEDSAEYDKQVKDLSADDQSYYAILERLSGLKPSECTSKLAGVSSSLTPTTQAEALFFVGCLAIEEGDSESAVRLLGDSEDLQPDSRFRAIRRLHLGRLMAP